VEGVGRFGKKSCRHGNKEKKIIAGKFEKIISYRVGVVYCFIH
jgi:hypothetical protein